MLSEIGTILISIIHYIGHYAMFKGWIRLQENLLNVVEELV